MQEQNLVGGGRAICDGEELNSSVEAAEAGVVEAVEAGIVEVTDAVDERPDFGDDEKEHEKGPSHLSANDENDRE